MKIKFLPRFHSLAGSCSLILKLVLGGNYSSNLLHECYKMIQNCPNCSIRVEQVLNLAVIYVKPRNILQLFIYLFNFRFYSSFEFWHLFEFAKKGSCCVRKNKLLQAGQKSSKHYKVRYYANTHKHKKKALYAVLAHNGNEDKCVLSILYQQVKTPKNFFSLWLHNLLI